MQNEHVQPQMCNKISYKTISEQCCAGTTFFYTIFIDSTVYRLNNRPEKLTSFVSSSPRKQININSSTYDTKYTESQKILILVIGFGFAVAETHLINAAVVNFK